ncbi:MAG TPA: hypothetical protein VKR22_14875 [Acidimicrobiales bacterium]|nr:hypothetical protein [Acidimicrobiales bacterium]
MTIEVIDESEWERIASRREFEAAELLPYTGTHANVEPLGATSN